MNRKNENKKFKKQKKLKRKKIKMNLKSLYRQKYSLLKDADINYLVSTVMDIPENYVKNSENVKDPWNYSQIRVSLGIGIGDYNIGVNAKKLNECIERAKIESKKIPIKELKKQIKYNSVGTDDSSKSQGPIVILNMFNNHKLILDGNHRLNDLIKQNKEECKFFLVNDKFLIKNNLFVTDYDFELYKAAKIIDDYELKYALNNRKLQ